ncbi:MAG: cysteine--1-D-myo-inosityl 2-amino-2-deoxy-alpha-D-glucopyranoside ligase [Actinobacteria bacterium]|uniref:L-cysteine:1D-myo-inositol 2-amino-2-deoxy-alpha-D-glucopyranoside ligase n=1 Tax=freshwater metagenome TaxID=449393 RepID=A0A6J7S1Y8_9ZZZZ|nr:cysteine--1-D-myo-inosityl 2-amino-2-deoxy-alpha-D-glucopyranoside ligase [Actinomycetota bacterium]
MHAWPAPLVPSLPGQGPALSLHDTATGGVRLTAPGPIAQIYVCGITPYDATHMGHAATYVAFDLVQRVWLDAGHEVHYVQNITDVDDPLLARALETGDDWVALGDRETQLFREDMTALQVMPPRHYIGAVESIPAVIRYIHQLQAAGAVYDLEGDLYFRVNSDPGFGSIAGLTPERMIEIFAERGGDPDRAGKEHPLDCLLWLLERPGDPSWESPFGRGRPGWHIECSAIALDHLVAPIDVQGGGSDLAFPHHEMGAAEAQVATGTSPFARHYTHAAMVRLDGEKMSKSRGNLVFVSKLRAAGIDSAAVRLAILAHHYRVDWDWTSDGLGEAQSRLASWRLALQSTSPAPADHVLAEVRARLADDLDAPGALTAIDRWAEATHARASAPAASDEGSAVLIRDLANALLGVLI